VDQIFPNTKNNDNKISDFVGESNLGTTETVSFTAARAGVTRRSPETSSTKWNQCDCIQCTMELDVFPWIQELQ